MARQGKVSGSYVLPYGVVASANYEHRSGDPQARQVLFSGGQVIRTIVLNVEPLGSIRLPNINLVDFRAAKQFDLGGGRVVELRADLYNLMNINTVTSRVLRSGPTCMIPTGIVLPRLVQLGASYTF